MTDHRFYDGVYAQARHGYRDSTRSYHVPARTRRRGWYVWLAVQITACAIPVGLIVAIWS